MSKFQVCVLTCKGSRECKWINAESGSALGVFIRFSHFSPSLCMKPFEKFRLYSQECTTRGSQQAYFSFCLDNNSIKPTKGADPPGQAQHRDNSPKHLTSLMSGWVGGKFKESFTGIVIYKDQNLLTSQLLDCMHAHKIHAVQQVVLWFNYKLKVFMKGKVSALFHGNSSSLFMKPFEEFRLYSQECTTRGSQQAYFSFCLDNNSIKPTKGADPPGQAQHRDNSPKHPKNKCCCPERCEPSKLIIALMENS